MQTNASVQHSSPFAKFILSSRPHPLTPVHRPDRVPSAVTEIQPQLHSQPAPRVQNPLGVSPPNPQQQQVLHAENGALHAQIAPSHSPPPPRVVQVVKPQAPRLNPARPQEQQQQQQQQKMTHPATTVLAPAAAPLRPSMDEYHRRTSSLGQINDPGRSLRPQQAQPLAPGQAPTRGQQVQQVASALLGTASGIQTRPQRALPSHTSTSERSQPIPVSAPASSPSSTQSQSQSQSQSPAQQQPQQDYLAPSSAIAAFRALQPVKALLEQTWSTAIACVQQELAVVQSELVRSSREQQRLSQQLKRSQVERAHALHALQDMKAKLGESVTTIQVERVARLQLERKLAELSTQCICGAATVMKLTAAPLPSLSQPLPSSSSSSLLPSSPAVITPTLATVNGEGGVSQVPPVAPTLASFPPADMPRELRREREEETVDEETSPKRRRITPTVISEHPNLATPAPLPQPLSTPEVSGVKKAAEADVLADTHAASHPLHGQRPESPPQESKQARDQPEGPLSADADATPAHPKIGIRHIQLVYETVEQTLRCRMCMLRKREIDEDTQVATYPLGAAYDELVGHCEQEHEAALDALASMSPSDIAEMHQRMLASQ
ncbi:hypothetical protein F5148DRAFT_1175087 [Russula earlei]|uniref:Uncharacterized protein n=1 Tax=Russula earlei TaxID=71964 RepID=A0ACC0UJI3_9AGAM|nr:hypothetical protein F5148DRAFT_1175087 [Russula earlei]